MKLPTYSDRLLDNQGVLDETTRKKAQMITEKQKQSNLNNEITKRRLIQFSIPAHHTQRPIIPTDRKSILHSDSAPLLLPVVPASIPTFSPAPNPASASAPQWRRAASFRVPTNERRRQTRPGDLAPTRRPSG